MQSGRKNGFFLGNKRIILGESAVVSRGLVRPCFDNAKVALFERSFVGFSRHWLAVMLIKNKFFFLLVFYSIIRTFAL